MTGGSYYDASRIKAEYDAFYRRTDFVRFPRSERAFVDALVRRYGIRPGSRVADVGCGTGKYAELFGKAGCDVFAIDLSEAAVQRARRAAPRATAVIGDLRSMPCADGTFDVVFASGVSLFNTADLTEVTPLVHHLCGLLKNGGLLVFVKTSALTDRPSKRGSRMDYTVESFETAFRSEPQLESLGRHAVFPQLFAVMGVAAFEVPASRISMAATALTGIPLRVYLLYRKSAQETARESGGTV